MMATSPDAVMGLDENGRIVIANERFRTLYGYAPEELIGQPATILTPPDLWKRTPIAFAGRWLKVSTASRAS